MSLGTEVALKLMEAGIASRPQMLARFQREAKALASLKSPYVVQVFDYGIDRASGAPYIVMELLEGENLDQRLNRRGRLTPEEVSLIMGQTCRAMARAHDAGLIHRDLKPDNIFVVRSDDQLVTKVLDFGIVKLRNPTALDAQTSTSSVLGTPYYMSPEQISGSKDIDHRADLWSIAVIAFQCLTGRRPFESDNLGGLVLEICTGPVPKPSSIANLPAGFDEWFARATQRSPDARFQSARELAAALVAICAPNTSLVSSSPELCETVDLIVPSGGSEPHPRPSADPIVPSDAGLAALGNTTIHSTTAESPQPAFGWRSKQWPKAGFWTGVGSAAGIFVILGLSAALWRQGDFEHAGTRADAPAGPFATGYAAQPSSIPSTVRAASSETPSALDSQFEATLLATDQHPSTIPAPSSTESTTPVKALREPVTRPLSSRPETILSPKDQDGGLQSLSHTVLAPTADNQAPPFGVPPEKPSSSVDQAGSTPKSSLGRLLDHRQ